jgi:hypothetical protein
MPRSVSIALAFVAGAVSLGCGAGDAGRPLVPARLQFTSQPPAIATSQLPLGSVRVEVVTEDGRLVTTQPVTVTMSLASSDTAAHLGGTTAMETALGVAAFTNLSVARAGSNFRLVARVTGLGSVMSSPFQIAAGAPARLSFDPLSSGPVTAGGNFPLVVRSTDAAGNPASASGTVTIGFSRVSPFGATIAPDAIYGTTEAPLLDGVATFAGINFQKTGGYILSASSPPLITATNAHLTVQSGPITQLAFITPPTNGAANVALAPFSVQQLDRYGNGWSIPPGPPYTVTLSLGLNPTGAVLKGTTTRTVFGSLSAKFDDITIDRPGSGYTLVAASGTMTVSSGPFTVQ